METSSNAEDRMAVLTERLSRTDDLSAMCHIQMHGEPLPSEESVGRIALLCRRLIFPGFFGDTALTPFNMPHRIGMALEELMRLLTQQISAGLSFRECRERTDDGGQRFIEAAALAEKFVAQLPELRRVLATDVEATYLGDPAALSTDEVVFSYPGIRATTFYRIAHALHVLGVPVIPRMISEQAHRETGIDIHPGATIGEAFVIDHGTGVVIGATAIIGHHVKIYQGVTLGALSFPTDDANNPVKGIPRHPIIGNYVTIYSNASVLGRITVGDGAVIGGNLWVSRPVMPGEKVVQPHPLEENTDNTATSGNQKH